LTGDAEFCSKEHRKIYQQEHNQLALARLLESQPKGKPAPRLEKPQRAEPPPVEIVEPVKKPDTPQPDLAGFMSETSFGPRAAAHATRSAGSPGFQQNGPLWSKIAAKSTLGLKPKGAGFLAESARPRPSAGKVRFQGQPSFKAKSVAIASAAKVRRPQPAGSGFLFEKSAAKPSFGKPRPPAEVRFGAISPISAWAAKVQRTSRVSRLPMGKFLTGYALDRTTPGKVRVPAVESRWKPLSAVLPEQPSGKIVFVLGSLLRRPIRPASQDLPPATFAIPLQPVVFPQYSPRMGCLEERLHRTDRIGFSPP
jgi:hypothetical protein